MALTGEWTRECVGELRQCVLDALEAHARVTVDLSDAGPVDAAFFQLLHAAGLEAGRQGVGLTLGDEISASVLEAAARAGFAASDGAGLTLKGFDGDGASPPAAGLEPPQGEGGTHAA